MDLGFCRDLSFVIQNGQATLIGIGVLLGLTVVLMRRFLTRNRRYHP